MKMIWLSLIAVALLFSGCVVLGQKSSASGGSNSVVSANSIGGLSITPNSGSHLGGTAVTVTGTGFIQGVNVTIGGRACTGLVFVSSTTIRCLAPAGTLGTADVFVINPNGGGSAVISRGFTFLNFAPFPVGVAGRAVSSGGGAAYDGSGIYMQGSIGEIGSPSVQTGGAIQSQTGVQSIVF